MNLAQPLVNSFLNPFSGATRGEGSTASLAVGDTGLEKTAFSSGNSGIDPRRAAKSGAFASEIDPDLQAVIDAWPALDDATRAKILGLIKGA